MKALGVLAQACAIFGALLMVAATLLVCVSVLGRETIGKTITGDLELVAYAAGAAVALFMPWCQLQRGHIIVDFFTAKSSPTVQASLDRVGAAMLGLLLAFVTWRTGIGGMNAWNANEGSMMLALPNWVVYAFMCPALGLTALIAFAQAAMGFDAAKGDAA